jgi:hypothetical protein
MNGTCSGTHIIYQCALSLPLSHCTPFTCLNFYFAFFARALPSSKVLFGIPILTRFLGDGSAGNTPAAVA